MSPGTGMQKAPFRLPTLIGTEQNWTSNGKLRSSKFSKNCRSFSKKILWPAALHVWPRSSSLSSSFLRSRLSSTHAVRKNRFTVPRGWSGLKNWSSGTPSAFGAEYVCGTIARLVTKLPPMTSTAFTQRTSTRSMIASGNAAQPPDATKALYASRVVKSRSASHALI